MGLPSWGVTTHRSTPGGGAYSLGAGGGRSLNDDWGGCVSHSCRYIMLALHGRVAVALTALVVLLVTTSTAALVGGLASWCE